MAYTYATMFPVAAGHDFYADQLNFLRESISRHATVSGATVTLPATMADDEPIDTDDELFHDWLDAARTAIEAIEATDWFLMWGGSGFAPWGDIGTLLAYVHNTWETATFKPGGTSTAWYPYTDPSSNNDFCIGYVNEIYYCLECLCYYEVECTRDTADLSAKDGDGGAVTRYDAWDLGWDDFEASSYAGSTGAHGAQVKSHLYQYNYAWFYYVYDKKVTGGHITVPDEDYPLTQLLVPFKVFKDAVGTPLDWEAACPEAGSVTTHGAWASPDYHVWVGFIHLWSTDLDNETIHVNYNFVNVDRDHWGSTTAHDWTMDAFVEDPDYGGVFFGRTAFSGYSNAAYFPSFT